MYYNKKLNKRDIDISIWTTVLENVNNIHRI